MDHSYWIKRWERGETGWHQKEPEVALLKYFGGLSPRKVFVPLCGRSLDLLWLASQKHEVIGVEISEMGCKAFFSENNIPATRSEEGEFALYSGGGIKIYNGDFFKLTPAILGNIDAVYDRAALIALPSDLRKQYAAHLTELIRFSNQRLGFEFLQLALERTPHDENGPPFSVSMQELQSLYGHYFKISLVSREKVEMSSPSTAITEESVYQLRSFRTVQ